MLTSKFTEVLFFCVGFCELSNLTRDLSQAENKIIVVTNWAIDKMTILTFLSEINVILSICSDCNKIFFVSLLKISHVLNAKTHEN